MLSLLDSIRVSLYLPDRTTAYTIDRERDATGGFGWGWRQSAPPRVGPREHRFQVRIETNVVVVRE